MKRFLAALIAAAMVLACVPAFAAIPAANTQRTQKLDLTGYNSSVSNSNEGWSYNPTGHNGKPMLVLNSYGSANAHSAPILLPPNSYIEVNGNCYIDNALMGEQCDCISGCCDGYLMISGRGTLNLYADQYHGRGISVPTGGAYDGTELLYIENITVNYYGMERTPYTAFYLEAALYGNEEVHLKDMTLNTEEGGYAVRMIGYGPAYPYTEDNVTTMLIEGCNINVHSVTGDNWGYAKGLYTTGGNIRIRNSNIVMEAGTGCLYTHYTLFIDEGSNIEILSHPLTTATAHAAVYYTRLAILNGIERFHVKLTKYTVGDVLGAREEYTSTLGDQVTVTKGSFENGNFHGITPTQENWPEFEAVGNNVQPTYYTVNFYDYDGTLLSTQQVEEGHAATAPEPPVHFGRVFKGWNADFSYVTSDLDVTAIYALLGDADCNGEVTFADVSVIYLFLLGNGEISEQGLINADFDQNGAVEFSDISEIYLFIIGE